MDGIEVGIGVANNFFRNGVDSARGFSRIGGLSPEQQQQLKNSKL
jgi:hypothetical protein